MNITKILNAIQDACAATDIDYYLIGAQARNIWYERANQPARHTQDVDFVVIVPGGDRYDTLRAYLSKHSNFRATNTNHFVMLTEDDEEVDILPIDEMDKHGNNEGLLNGLNEVYHAGTQEVKTESGYQFKVATLPAIVALKLIAFDDRPELRDKDPGDIAGILRVFFEIDYAKIYENNADIFTRDYLELEDVAAIVIGREIRRMGETNLPWINRIRSILTQHIANGSESQFIRMMIGSSGETAIKQVKRLERILEGINDKISAQGGFSNALLLGLKGVANSGKTTTIRMLYSMLVEKGFQRIKKMHGDPDNLEEIGDFSAVLEKGETRVGITSAGDTFDLLSDRLAELHDNNCQVYVCACRSYDRGRGTNTAIAEFSERYHCEVVTILKQKKDKAQHIEVNANDANYMNEKIQERIK